MTTLTSTAKALIAVLALGAGVGGYFTHRHRWTGEGRNLASARDTSRAGGHLGLSAGARFPVPARQDGELIVALSEGPGHMPLVLANGGLVTQPGSAVAAADTRLRLVFIEDQARKVRALADGSVDFLWQAVDELPITMPQLRAAGAPSRAFLQTHWSQGGDACVAGPRVQRIEDLPGRNAAMMLFSAGHTLFEFMISNSRLDRNDLARIRDHASFSSDDYTHGRRLFAEGKADVACLWEPDVTLALGSRPGAHRLFSTADVNELVAGVLIARNDLLENRRTDAERVARAWFAGAAQANADRTAAARFVSSVVPRFRDELGLERTQAVFQGVRWTDVGDNALFFGLDGSRPAFDRVYQHADDVWLEYPAAKIEERFAPARLREGRVVLRLWEEAGRPPAAKPAALAAVDKDEPVAPAAIAKTFSISHRRAATAELDVATMALINQQVLPQLELARGMYVRVECHTDGVGSERSNRKLTDERATAIAKYLIDKGIDPARIVAEGNGSSRPLASNKSPEGRARNRRTEIQLLIASKAGKG